MNPNGLGRKETRYVLSRSVHVVGYVLGCSCSVVTGDIGNACASRRVWPDNDSGTLHDRPCCGSILTLEHVSHAGSWGLAYLGLNSLLLVGFLIYRREASKKDQPLPSTHCCSPLTQVASFSCLLMNCKLNQNKSPGISNCVG